LEVVMELRATVTGRALPEKELGLTPLGVDILAYCLDWWCGVDGVWCGWEWEREGKRACVGWGVERGDENLVGKKD
jgi:hypothetical protein